jgi:CAAX protease family protein
LFVAENQERYGGASAGVNRSSPLVRLALAAQKMLSSDVMPWDFALILIFLATAVPWLGRRRIRQLLQLPEITKSERLQLYASTIASQWVIAGVVLWRTAAHGIPAHSLGFAIPNLTLTATISTLLAALIFANQFISLRRIGLRPADAQGVLPQLALKIFPQDSAERLAFLAVVTTVAICEEFIYRGFVQRVFANWAGNVVLAGLFGSAAMFALAHLYQGRRGLVSTFIIGLLFAAVRAWTGSLLPSFVAHFVADLTAGLMAPSRVRSALTRLEGGVGGPGDAR